MGTVWQPRLVYDVEQQLSSAPAAADKLPLNGLSLSKAIQREHTYGVLELLAVVRH